MTSPDYTPYVDLTLHDKSPADILAAGISTLQARIPGWVPQASNIEVLLLEALAIEVGETLFSLNRIPRALILTLLTSFGVTPDHGAQPHMEVTFTAQDDSGYLVPAGTEIALLVNEADYSADNEYMTFRTNTDLAIVSSEVTGTVIATGDQFTDAVNGIVNNSVELIDSITGIESVAIASPISGGSLPETEDALIQRGVQRFSRLSDTLVTPSHFTQAVLEIAAGATRVTAIDNWDAVSGSPGENPGCMTVVVYGDNAPFSDGEKAALRGELELRAVTNLRVFVIDPVIQNVDVTATIAVLPDYTASSVISAVNTMLTEYLSPSSWPWSGTIRRNELISVIDQVSGVDYVDTLTTPANDIVITAENTLAHAGVLTITEV